MDVSGDGGIDAGRLKLSPSELKLPKEAMRTGLDVNLFDFLCFVLVGVEPGSIGVTEGPLPSVSEPAEMLEAPFSNALFVGEAPSEPFVVSAVVVVVVVGCSVAVVALVVLVEVVGVAVVA